MQVVFEIQIHSLKSILNTKYKYSTGNVFVIQNTFDHVFEIQNTKLKKYNILAPSSFAMLEAIPANPDPPPIQRNFNIGLGLGNHEFSN